MTQAGHNVKTCSPQVCVISYRPRRRMINFAEFVSRRVIFSNRLPRGNFPVGAGYTIGDEQIVKLYGHTSAKRVCLSTINSTSENSSSFAQKLMCPPPLSPINGVFQIYTTSPINGIFRVSSLLQFIGEFV